MSLTRIGSIGINTGIAFAGVTTIVTLNTANDALSIGATVNVGSGITLGASGDIFATGVSTVTTLKVGSGVTVSSDGDIFATGVTTATTFSGSGANLTNLPAANLTGTLPAISGANLTNLDASDLASGTVPTARLGSGTASSSTFLRGDSTFQTVNTDLVSDTSPQLGGELQSNGNDIRLADSDILYIGTSGDGTLYHDGSNTYLSENGTGELYVQGNTFVAIRSSDTGENMAKFIRNGAVELYYDNGIRLTTTSTGINVSQAGSGSVSNFSHGGGAGGVRIAGPAASSGANLIFANNFDNSVSDEWAIQLDGSNDGLVFVEGGAGGTEKLRIASNGRVNIGSRTTTPDELVHIHTASGEANVHIEAATNARVKIRAHSGESIIQFADAAASNPGEINYTHSSDAMSFRTNNSVQATINSGGTLHLGATSYGGGGSAPLFYVSGTSGRQVKIHNTNSGTTSIQLTNAATGQGEDQGFMLAALSSRAAYVANIEPFPIYFATDGNIRATISGSAEQMVVGAQDGFTDYGINNGILTAYATSGYNASYHVLKVIHANTSFSETGGGAFFIGCRRQSTAAYNLAGWYSGNGSSSVADDRQYRFRADGNAYADASWNGGGADYAEFFEWLDGNSSDEDRKGISVVLDNGKIRAATGSDNTDNIIGVISANPVVVGDSASERWKEKWITDDFGGSVEETYTITEWYDETEKRKVNYPTDSIPSDVTVGVGSSVLSTDENGNAYTRKKLNPSWDSTATYIPREERKEWDIVGLMGKLKVKSDQPVGTRWIKIREVSASVHEYLIR